MDQLTRTPSTSIPAPQSIYNAIDYVEKAIAAGVSPQEIETNLLPLYTPVARNEYSTRRHQMTYVATLISMQAGKIVDALQSRVAALEAQVAALTAAPKLRDQLKRPRKVAQARAKVAKAKSKPARRVTAKTRKLSNRRGAPAFY